jgi:hypothetical protein
MGKRMQRYLLVALLVLLILLWVSVMVGSASMVWSG